MTLTIHWSKCDAPHTEVIKDVKWVCRDALGLRYQRMDGAEYSVPNGYLADAWEVTK